jgi:hypothetical protein
VPHRLRVARRAGVGRPDEVDEACRGEHGEGLAAGQQVEVAADDDQVVGFADGVDEAGDPLRLRAPARGVGLAAPVAQAVQVDDGHRASGARLDEPQRHGRAGTVVARPLVVLGESAVHGRRPGADDHQTVGDERAQPERLPVPTAVVAGDRPGVAGDEQGLVVRQQGTHVREEACALRQGSLAVGEGRPAGQTGCRGDLLQADHVERRLVEPSGELVVHRATPGVEGGDEHLGNVATGREKLAHEASGGAHRPACVTDAAFGY